jgi:16S rRNA (uracil1498-N3)-methyltransferase
MKKTASSHSHERRFISSRREDGLAVLLEEEAHHLQNVLRLTQGDEVVCIIPEENKAYKATIKELSKKEVVCTLGEEVSSSSENIVTHALVATTKPAINELIVEKLCELGVKNIFLYSADRSVGHEISDNKQERLKKLSVTATKQCGRASLSSIEFFDSLQKASEAIPTSTVKIWASLAHPTSLPHLAPTTTYGYALVVGPAGDFSSEEEAYLTRNKWHPMYLGNIRLREETAAIAGVCALHTVNMAR